MTKTTTRTAETTLTVRGSVDCYHPDAELEDPGDGDIDLRVLARRGSLRLHATVNWRVDGCVDDAYAEIIADLDPSEFPNLLGFERTIRAMVADAKADETALRARVEKAIPEHGTVFGESREWLIRRVLVAVLGGDPDVD